MIADLIDAIASLSAILDEENAQLGRADGAPLPPELVAAKLRLVGLIEAAGIGLEIDDADAAARLAGMIPAIVAKADVNAGLLRRRMELCDDLMGAISAEARRLAGGSSTTYGAQGAVVRTLQATPIAINNRY